MCYTLCDLIFMSLKWWYNMILFLILILGYYRDITIGGLMAAKEDKSYKDF